jgi:alpha-amylase/alpha-mannosidase (GH57 family)
LSHPLYVALVWHMHQPYYRDGQTGEYILPWVRLHAVKDYLHMAEVVARHPAMRLTFNVVPSLLEQLDAYATGQARDRLQTLALQPAWDLEERSYLLSNCFSIHWDNVIRRHPGYRRLLERRHQAQVAPERSPDSYYRDLVTWFNLAWIDPNWLESDPLLKALVEKGEGFDLDDTRAVLDKQCEMIARILPLYRSLVESGQIEISVSPYYHPILPLVVGNHLARRASPGLPLPNVPFAHPEDAIEQIRLAIEAYGRTIGGRPRGIWPSEGAVSPEIVFWLAAEGLDWFASDEGVLGCSVGHWVERDPYGHVTNPHLLYQPYATHVGDGSPAIIFRDRLLSDRIGFVYKDWAGRDAADDLIHRLHRIRESFDNPDSPYLVSIILDGENCWEGYEHNGDPFLDRLYGRLVADPDLCPVTVSGYLGQHPPRVEIGTLHTGSWINHNLETWIGEAEQNRAWEYLARTRDRLCSWQQEYALADLDVLEQAWQAIYIAEGSDWFWWYYSYNASDQDTLFDAAFRGHLASVYTVLGLPTPSWLLRPIAGFAPPAHERNPSAYIAPHLSATAAASLEWTGAGYLDPAPSSGTMQRGRVVIRRLYYGYNPADLFVRLELNEPISPYQVRFYLAVPGYARANRRYRLVGEGSDRLVPGSGLAWEIDLPVGAREATLSRADGQEVWRTVAPLPAVACDERVIELAVPLGRLGLQLGESLDLVVLLARDRVLVEALPESEALTLSLRPLT